VSKGASDTNRRVSRDAAPVVPAEIFQPRVKIDRRSVLLLLNLLTVVLLIVSFAPYDRWYMAYFALVPWGLALAGGTLRRWTILASYLGGLAFWALSLYWLTWVTPWCIGYGALVLYLSLYWLVASLIIRAALRRDAPMWITFPVVWVALEFARAYVISGFPWFFLAHSQYRMTRLIQIADMTGQYGVSFFVAMVNGALIDLLAAPIFRRKGQGVGLRVQTLIGIAASVVLGVLLWTYGGWRLSQQKFRTGPVIGIVQQAYPITFKGIGTDSDKILQDHIASSKKLAGTQLDLLIWPETMLPSGMNRQFLDLIADRQEPDFVELRRQAEQVGQLSRQLDCVLLAGGTALHVNPEPADKKDMFLVRNAALWFDRSDRPSGEYDKMHLVPFGEYVPFKNTWPGLHRFLRKFIPEAMSQLDPGREVARFELRDHRGRTWRIVTPICYEGTFARVCRRLVMQDGRKAADIIANISNDGWFVYRPGQGRYRASNEHDQHLASYCFRAVENRTPVVRAVNTGISASIDSNGRIVAVLQRYGVAKMVRGTLVLDGARGQDGQLLESHGPKVLVDDRLSVYSRIGDAFAIVVSVAAGGAVIYLMLSRTKSKQGQGARL